MLGVSFGGNTTAQAKLLIGQGKNLHQPFGGTIRTSKRQRNLPQRNRRLCCRLGN